VPVGYLSCRSRTVSQETLRTRTITSEVVACMLFELMCMTESETLRTREITSEVVACMLFELRCMTM
jgi:hypothetical protein